MEASPDHALIDADIVLHRVGFTTENDEFWIAKARCDDMLDKILLDTGVLSYDLWLSDNSANNFRYSIYPLYKANRIGKPKPKHHEDLKEHLITEWGAKFAEGMEADDYLGICQDEEHKTTVICSIDKDLKQISGLHYNFVNEEWEEVTKDQAIKSFYKQIAIGDTADNIPGAQGIGPVKAGKAIDHLEGSVLEDSCFQAVYNLYRLSLEKEWGKPWTKDKEAALYGMILLSGRLLKIKRSFNEPLWDFPVFNPMEDCLSLSTPPMVVESDLFTEPTLLDSTMVGSQ